MLFLLLQIWRWWAIYLIHCFINEIDWINYGIKGFHYNDVADNKDLVCESGKYALPYFPRCFSKNRNSFYSQEYNLLSVAGFYLSSKLRARNYAFFDIY